MAFYNVPVNLPHAATLANVLSFSQYVMQALSNSTNYTALVVMDSGRRPTVEEMQESLDAVTDIAKTIRSTLT